MNAGSAAVAAVIEIIYMILDFYIWILIIGAVMSWLVAFDVINLHNRFVRLVSDFIFRLTEPLLKPLRNVLPVLGGMDLSPLVLIFIILFLQSFLRHLVV
jgi:YggT family protein